MVSIKDKYLTIKTVADMLSCTERHINDLIVEGELIAIKIGSRAMRVSEQSLNEFIEKNKVNPEDIYDPDREKKQAPSIPVTQQIARSKFMSR
jgi:excisionase family DNA binding protein